MACYAKAEVNLRYGWLGLVSSAPVILAIATHARIRAKCRHRNPSISILHAREVTEGSRQPSF
jgi:hypothetical protein